MRLLAFLDESGSFELADGHVDGMGLLVVPDEPEVLRSIRVQVEWLEEIARSEERIRGKVKGSHLRLERFPMLARFLADHGIKLSPFVAGQRRMGSGTESMMVVASRVASAAKRLGMERRGLEIAKSLLDIAPSPRYYCEVAYHLMRCGALATLVRSGAPHVEVVYDRRLDDGDTPTLHVAIGSALAELLEMQPTALLEGLLGLGALPWSVRPEEPHDWHALQLTDWVLYPQVVVHRPDVSALHRSQYHSICDLYEELGIVVYPMREAGGDAVTPG